MNSINQEWLLMQQEHNVKILVNSLNNLQTLSLWQKIRQPKDVKCFQKMIGSLNHSLIFYYVEGKQDFLFDFQQYNQYPYLDIALKMYCEQIGFGCDIKTATTAWISW